MSRRAPDSILVTINCVEMSIPDAVVLLGTDLDDVLSKLRKGFSPGQALGTRKFCSWRFQDEDLGHRIIEEELAG